MRLFGAVDVDIEQINHAVLVLVSLKISLPKIKTDNLWPLHNNL